LIHNPYIFTKEPYTSAKEPYVLAKEPYISVKEFCISAKEHHVSPSKKPYIELGQQAMGVPTQDHVKRAQYIRK